jgi:hypothetical protein
MAASITPPTAALAQLTIFKRMLEVAQGLEATDLPCLNPPSVGVVLEYVPPAVETKIAGVTASIRIGGMFVRNTPSPSELLKC